MAGFAHSKDSVYEFDGPSDSSGTIALINISSFVTGVEGLPGEDELNEITALGDQGRKNLGGVGMQAANMTLNIMYKSDPSSSGGSHNLATALFGSTVTKSFRFSPDSTGSGKQQITGECWATNMNVRSRLGDMVAMDVELQVDGVVTIAAI